MLEKMDAPEKFLFRPREAAIATGTSPAWIYARIAEGSLRSVRLAGRAIRIRREDLLDFIERGVTAATR